MWERPDRMRRALRYAGIGVGDMAEYLGLSRNAVGNYLGGRSRPDMRTLRLWALRTGVDLHWLLTGETSDERSLTRHSTDIDGPLSVAPKLPFRRSGGGTRRPPGRVDSRCPSRPVDHRHPLGRKPTRPLSGAA